MNYRKIISRISAVSMAAVMSVSALSGGSNMFRAEYEDDISVLERRQAELAEERKQLEAVLNEYDNAVEEQEEYLRLYDDKMALQEEEMSNINEQIELINEQMKELDYKIALKTAEVDKGIEEFRERLRAMYIAGNDSIAQVLAGSADFYDMLARMEMVQRVSQHDNDMITALTHKIQELNLDKEALEAQYAELDEKKANQLKVLEELQATYANHQETLEWYEAKAEAQRSLTSELVAEEEAVEAELQEYIRQQQAEVARIMEERRQKEEAERRKKEEAERKRLEEEQKKLEEEKKKQEEEQKRIEEQKAAENSDEGEDQVSDYSVYTDEDMEEAPDDTWEITMPDDNSSDDFYDPYSDYEFGKTYEEENESSSGYGTSGTTGFIWPVPTVRNITDGYGERYIVEEGSSSFHKGIDINKPDCYGETIVASAGGVVLTASDTGNGYGIHVVIDHGNGISTLYAHMSDVDVSVGDEVQQGQVIGYIGSTGYAYGNHLHFEVRVDGAHTDPFGYVSMDN